MAKVLILGLLDKYIRAIGKMNSLMVMVKLYILMEISMRVNGKMI